MSILRFNDGMTLDTSGQLRVVRKRDGYYVLGEGMSLPVDSRKEGLELIREMQESK